MTKEINGKNLTVDFLVSVSRNNCKIKLSKDSVEKIKLP